jgi:hypothetical protein
MNALKKIKKAFMLSAPAVAVVLACQALALFGIVAYLKRDQVLGIMVGVTAFVIVLVLIRANQLMKRIRQ